MIAVIICGGSGTRLWPLSQPDHPKHLLRLAGEKSLLQNTLDRARLLTNDIYLVTDSSHVEKVYAQAPEISKTRILAEPARRGTASCILLALSSIKEHHDPNEPIVFMHADHNIRDTASFSEAVTHAAKVSKAESRIVLLGVEPTSPATGFGYIEREEQHPKHERVYHVKSFKEKPEHATAKKYVRSGRYLWNMGFFVAPLAVFESALKNHAPHLWENYQVLNKDRNKTHENYLKFESEPIDTALIERVDNLLVTPGLFDWMDLGSFSDLHAANEQNEKGNVIDGAVELEDVTNSFIRNETTLPVAVIGLDNVVVVATENGIVVSNKNYAQRVGDIAKRISQ